MLSIFVISLILRFWNLSQFNKLVFDEVYYAKFANNYLTGTPFFNAHPPLSQYIIAIGMEIGSHFPSSYETLNNLTGSWRSTFSYRWLNALTGSFIPLVVAAIAYQLNQRRSYAVIAVLFVAADGLFLVESRYALNNIYLVLFGLLGQLFFLLALRNNLKKYWQLSLAGVFFGASACIKWNGLWFLLGIYLILIIAYISLGLKRFYKENNHRFQPSFWDNLTKINLLSIVVNLVIIPILTYSLLWIPHLKMNPQYGFWRMQEEILSYHERIGSGAEVHPYCSTWYSWLVMWRPIAYFYEASYRASGKIIYDVHAMGNPLLWWLSLTAIILVFSVLIMKLWVGEFWRYAPQKETWIGCYIISNYLANLLPWVKVTRCIFLYHYMGAYVLAILALAWLVDTWLQSQSNLDRKSAIAIILVIIFAFIYWLPIYLGLPLSEQAYQRRMFFPNWI